MSRRAKLLWLVVVALVCLAALFVGNGVNGSWRVPESGVTDLAAAKAGPTLTIMAFNVAKLSFHRGGFEFASAGEVRDRLGAIAAMVRSHDVDLLFLSEVVFEAPPWTGDASAGPVNQVVELAELAGFHAWVYGDNYSWGIPSCRIRSGNAVLSRFPLRGRRVSQLVGAAPFWDPSNNRRLLWAEVQLGEEWLPCASLRNDSFDLENNARQVRQILADMPAGPVLLAGDFNAEPTDESMRLLRESQRFLGVFEGALTFPARMPTRRIDTVLVPTSFARIVTQRVLDVDLSDHEPVLLVAER